MTTSNRTEATGKHNVRSWIKARRIVATYRERIRESEDSLEKAGARRMTDAYRERDRVHVIKKVDNNAFRAPSVPRQWAQQAAIILFYFCIST